MHSDSYHRKNLVVSSPEFPLTATCQQATKVSGTLDHSTRRLKRLQSKKERQPSASKESHSHSSPDVPNYPTAPLIVPLSASSTHSQNLPLDWKSPESRRSYTKSHRKSGSATRTLCASEEGRAHLCRFHLSSSEKSPTQTLDDIRAPRSASCSDTVKKTTKLSTLEKDLTRSHKRKASENVRPSRTMGGCVSKNGSSQPALTDGTVIPSQIYPDRKLKTTNGQSSKSQSTATGSPSTKPTEASNVSSPQEECNQSLKYRERRRLSLSQSDPARPDTADSNIRGQLLINQSRGSIRSGSGMLDSTQPNNLAEVVAKRHSDEEDSLDDVSFSSSDEEAASRRKESEEAKDIQSPPTGSREAEIGVHQRECRRLSVSGMPSCMKQDNFENKRQEVKSDTGFFDANTLLGLGIGYACKKGLKPESPNQDDFFIVRIDDWGLYGVFDGHGPYGHDVSNFVQRELPKLIYNDPNFISNPREALRASFVAVHQMLEAAAQTHQLFDCSLSGSTATVVLHRKMTNKLFIAHVGDSRCVLGRLSKSGRKIESVDLSHDHKPNTESEKKRIVASGGVVRRLEGDIPYRVFLKGRLFPGLAMSRAIGDTVGAQAGVICEPDVSEYSIQPERDLFITLCSDGVWEFLSSAEVAEVIHSYGIRGVQNAADIVARESWNRWIQEEGNVVDDITSEVIYLNPEEAIHSNSQHGR